MRGRSRHVRVRVDAVVLVEDPVASIPSFSPGDVAEAACKAVGLEGIMLPGARVSINLTTKRPEPV